MNQSTQSNSNYQGENYKDLYEQLWYSQLVAQQSANHTVQLAMLSSLTKNSDKVDPSTLAQILQMVSPPPPLNSTLLPEQQPVIPHGYSRQPNIWQQQPYPNQPPPHTSYNPPAPYHPPVQPTLATHSVGPTPPPTLDISQMMTPDEYARQYRALHEREGSDEIKKKVEEKEFQRPILKEKPNIYRNPQKKNEKNSGQGRKRPRKKL